MTENGFGKRTSFYDYRVTNRGGKGVKTISVTEKTGKLVSILEVVDTDDIMIITDGGVMIRQTVSAIRTIGRNTQGVRLIKLDNGSKISSVTKVVKEDEETPTIEEQSTEE